jgi:two-component system, chemotaxis family, protein-glutamate methylesterase/glutaminase
VEAASDGNPAGKARRRDLVVIGASAGGVDALQDVVAQLPPEFPAAVLVVLHVASAGTSVLPQILSRSGPLPAAFAEDGEPLMRGQIYVAPPDHHMLVHGSHVELTQGPRENGNRPAIDPLFRSAARAGDGRCIGVVLSGLLDDGASGLRFIKDHGGSAVVQSPDEALFPNMPRAALALAPVDRVAGAAEIATALCELIEAPIEERRQPEHQPPAAIAGRDRVELEDPADTAELLEGPPTGLTCPECGGAVWEQASGGVVRFACHVGHAYSVGTLLEEQGRALETTLWSAVRALEERADLHRRLARRARGARSEIYEERARDAERHARSLREMLSVTGRLAAPAPEQS